MQEACGPTSPPDRMPGSMIHLPTKHLVGGIEVGSVFRQTLHDVVVAPGRGCQERRLSFSILNVHVAAGFAKGSGHGVIAVPGSTVQGGFFFLTKETHT